MRIPSTTVLTFLVCGVLLPGTARGQGVYQFLRNDISPRIAAMGGSFTSMQGDPNSVFINPAALGSVQDTRLSISYLDHLLDINAGSAALTLQETPVGALTVGIQYLHYGTFDKTDQSANSYGTFTASDMAVSVGSSYELEEHLTVGAGLTFISSNLGDYSSSGIAADLGALYVIPDQRISIGLSLLHAGTQLSTYDGRNESLPTDLRIGITKRPEHLPVLLNFNLHGLNESGLSFSERLKQFSFGAEFEMSTSLRLRLGFNNRVRRDMRMGTSAGLAGFSIGTGITISGYRVDYAFNSYGAIGGLHRLGLTTSL